MGGASSVSAQNAVEEDMKLACIRDLHVEGTTGDDRARRGRRVADAQADAGAVIAAAERQAAEEKAKADAELKTREDAVAARETRPGRRKLIWRVASKRSQAARPRSARLSRPSSHARSETASTRWAGAEPGTYRASGISDMLLLGRSSPTPTAAPSSRTTSSCRATPLCACRPASSSSRAAAPPGCATDERSGASWSGSPRATMMAGW